MRSGKLRKRVYLQQPCGVANDYGEPVVTWVTYATVWADIEPLSGRDQILAQQSSSPHTYKITIRYIKHINGSHRILYGTRIFEINSVINWEERNVYLELQCTELK